MSDMNNFQVGIIGGGPAGYTAAEAAAKAGLSVILFEKDNLGGVCLNEGCIPTKTLLYSAKVKDMACSAAKYGVECAGATADMKKIMSRKSKIIRKLVLGIKARLTTHNVQICSGSAYIIDKENVRCNDTEYHVDHLILCTGSQTAIPPIKGLAETSYWTHREALDCKELPQSLAIIGGGVIGMEFASFFVSMGTKVTVIEMADEILPGIDREISSLLRKEYEKKGIQFLLGRQVDSVTQTEEGFHVLYHNEEEQTSILTEQVMVCAGRRPTTEGFGLENLNLTTGEKRRITVDQYMQSSVPGVYVCGDLNGTSMLAHTAVKEAEIAVAHIAGKNEAMCYNAVPGVVYTNPEVASVGMTEERLQAENIPYKALQLPLSYSGRFVAENEGYIGTIKVLTDPEGVILGVHIIGNPASELIIIGGMMIADRKKVEDFKKYIFPHPTVSEIFHEL